MIVNEHTMDRKCSTAIPDFRYTKCSNNEFQRHNLVYVLQNRPQYGPV